MPQDNHLIAGTATDNIRFFREEFDNHDVGTAAKAAHIHQELAELPNGMRARAGGIA